MTAIYNFLALYEGLIYILLALGGLFAFRWLWRAWREWRDSIFGLEREFAMRRLSRALMVLLLILFLFFSELFLVSFFVPVMSASDVLSTPTLDMLDQTQGALSSALIGSTTPVPSDLGQDAEKGNGCIPGTLDVVSPEPGQEVSGIVTLIGTVNIANFGFYKYEVSPQGAGAWITISAGRDSVRNGELGLWDTTTLTPGDYELSLKVTDNQGSLLPPCVILVRVSAP